MQKAKLIITETLEYNREIIVNLPDGMTKADLEEALEDGDREWGGADEFVHELKKHGITCDKGWDTDLDSPDSIESECMDYEIIED